MACGISGRGAGTARRKGVQAVQAAVGARGRRGPTFEEPTEMKRARGAEREGGAGCAGLRGATRGYAGLRGLRAGGATAALPWPGGVAAAGLAPGLAPLCTI